VQRRLQRRAEEKAREISAATKSARDGPGRNPGRDNGAYTPKGTWAGQITGRLTGRNRNLTARGGNGAYSSRSTMSTARSMLSTSRSMMTTCRSDVATGRYNGGDQKEATEFRPIDTSSLEGLQPEDEGAAAPRKHNKTAATTAASLRAGLVRRGMGRSSSKGNTTGRTPRTGRQKGERPSWA